MARKSAKKQAKVAVEPGRAALPRSKRELPAHVKAAADRAEARAKGKKAPKPPKGPKTRLDDEDEAERARLAALAVVEGETPASGSRFIPPPRETDYRPEFADRVTAMVGAVTTWDVAQELGVSERTVYRWKRIHTPFCQAITDKRENFDDEIEHSLGTRAKGYFYDDVHISAFQGSVTQTPIVKHMPADVGAAKHWLANRRPEKWRNDADGAPQVPAMSETDRNLFDVARKLVNVLHLATLKTQQMANAVVISGESVRVDAAE